jgi:hypothetical protein
MGIFFNDVPIEEMSKYYPNLEIENNRIPKKENEPSKVACSKN